jgi:hypothetical protein
MSNYNDRENFIKLTSKFFEAGLLKEIYNVGNVSICNMADTSYVLFSYDMYDENTKNYSGIMFNGKKIREVVNNPELVLIGFMNGDLNKKRNLLVPLTERSFSIMKGLKSKTDITGPTQDIDLEFEDSLKQKSR